MCLRSRLRLIRTMLFAKMRIYLLYALTLWITDVILKMPPTIIIIIIQLKLNQRPNVVCVDFTSSLILLPPLSLAAIKVDDFATVSVVFVSVPLCNVCQKCEG